MWSQCNYIIYVVKLYKCSHLTGHKYCVQSEPASPHQDEVCPVWGSCALSPAVLYCCSFGGVCWVPFQQWDTPGASHPIFLQLSCEHFTTFCHWWQRNDRVLGKSHLNAERKCYFAYTTHTPPTLSQCPNALIARSSVLGAIIIFKLELYVLRYLRATVCHHRSTVHGSVHAHKVEHECIYNIITQFCTHTDVVI